MAERWECTCDMCGKEIKYMNDRTKVAVLVAEVTDEEEYGQETLFRTPDFDVCPDCYNSLKQGGRRTMETLLYQTNFSW